MKIYIVRAMGVPDLSDSVQIVYKEVTQSMSMDSSHTKHHVRNCSVTMLAD